MRYLTDACGRTFVDNGLGFSGLGQFATAPARNAFAAPSVATVAPTGGRGRATQPRPAPGRSQFPPITVSGATWDQIARDKNRCWAAGGTVYSEISSDGKTVTVNCIITPKVDPDEEALRQFQTMPFLF